MVWRSAPASSKWVAKQWRLCLSRHSRHYLPFLTMSSEMGEPGNRSIITARNSNRVDQSLDIVFSVFSALQTIEEAKQLVSWLVAPWSAERR